MKQCHVALSILVAALTLLLSFSLAQGDDAEALEMAEGLAQLWEDAVSQQDAAAVAQLFTEDRQFISAAGEEFIGRQAIQENQEMSFTEFGLSEVSLPVIEASFSGTWDMLREHLRQRAPRAKIAARVTGWRFTNKRAGSGKSTAPYQQTSLHQLAP